MKVRIALLQLMPEKDLQGQLRKGKNACRKARKMGADIALFPEMWSDGYDLPQDAEELDALALNENSKFISAFKEIEKKKKKKKKITFLEKHDPKPLNSIILFDRRGSMRLHYSKVHTCDFDLEKALSPGDDFHPETPDTYPLHPGGFERTGPHTKAPCRKTPPETMLRCATARGIPAECSTNTLWSNMTPGTHLRSQPGRYLPRAGSCPLKMYKRRRLHMRPGLSSDGLFYKRVSLRPHL